MKNMEKIEIINKADCKHPFIVVKKPQGLPSAPLYEGDFSALTLAGELFPEIKNVAGRKSVEHGLIHRIDTETSGLILIALTDDFYEFMMKEQEENRFEKWYRAQVDFAPSVKEKLPGFPPPPFSELQIEKFITDKKTFTVQSRFRKFSKGGKEVRPVTEESGKAAKKKTSSLSEKLYSTDITFISENEVRAHITKGFRHQVRSHLAWINFPIKGDPLYNPESLLKENNMKFEAFKIKFFNPLTGCHQVFEI